MSILESVLLGLLQGFTEFLPVSSSGHLTIAQSLIDGFSQPGLLYDLLLHFATLFAVLIYFRKRVGVLIKAFFGIFFNRYNSYYFENKRFLWCIVVASIPTAVIGLFLEQHVTDIFKSTISVGYALIFTSILLIISDNFQGRLSININNSFILGIIQGIAVIPGISRSGSTIAIGVMMGIKRDEIAEFSFLMSVPAILGATILQVMKVDYISTNELIVYGFGMLSAFISGLIAIGFMLFFVKTAKMKFFAVYCLLAGIFTVIFL